ncbi:MAG: hypothetical protein Kow00108_19370 [Calditrichia bacterium]
MKKTWYNVFILLLIILFSVGAFARNKNEKTSLKKGDPQAQAVNFHKIGNLWQTVSNFGRRGDPNAPSTGLPSANWPGGTQKNYLWHGSFAFGGIVDGEVRVSHAEYSAYEFGPTEGTEFLWPPSDQKSMEDGLAIYDDIGLPHSTQELGIRVEERTLAWATPGYNNMIATEYTVKNVSGKSIYDVFAGWVYDSDIGTVADPSDPHIDDLVDWDGFDPDDPARYQIDIVENIDYDGDGKMGGYDEWGIPYGQQFVGNPEQAYPNYDPSKIKPDGFWDTYTVYLDENGPVIKYQNSVPELGIEAGDPAIVNGDTLKGWVFSRNVSYMFDADNNSTPKWDTGERDEPFGPIDGFYGGLLLYTPHAPYNVSEEDQFIRPFAHQWWNWETDPGSDLELYNYMTANHESAPGIHMKQNPLKVGAPTFDYRWFTATGPFEEFKNGEELKFIYVEVIGLGLEGMRQAADNAYYAYYAGSVQSNPASPSDFDSDVHWAIPVAPPVPQLFASPLDRGVKLVWTREAETAIDPILGINDFVGYKVYRAAYTPTNWEMIAAFDNVDGEVPVVDYNGDTLGMADLPDLTNSFIDQGGTFLGREIVRPVNGIPYYYAVAAYDTDKPERGLFSLESPLTNFPTDPLTGAPAPIYPKGLYEDEQQTTFDLDKILVVPNPYKGSSLFEREYEDKIYFINLPPACKISIFTISGDLVKEIYHNDGSDVESWDLVSRNTMSARTGLYIYVVETEKQVYRGKFVILK